ncbi:uncharacterized protein [Linepithema humile]|uniref:uncharacterized protein n=1 Tax=Linepithema humile TaxID=83485 RepID=UPI0006234657|nr:PREDICTED: uncharacterized protein LOC105667453 [Linepithema humile]
MIGKQSQSFDNEDNQSRIKLIANKRRFLEERSAQIETEIRNCFEELTKVLQSREKQLLRQAEAIHRQQLSLVETSLNFLPSSIIILNDRTELKKRISQFGNIEIHGLNGITVKDVEPYKVADYQDANKDHVSFDKSITCQKIRDDLNFPCCKDFKSDCRILRILSLPSAFLPENQLQDSQNMKDKALMTFNDTLFLSGCSPLLIIKRKLGLTHVSLDGLHTFSKIYSRNVQPFEISYETAESCGLDILTSEGMEANLQELDKEVVSHYDDIESIRCSRKKDKNYEHPIQVQQWLRQILAETETEPAIHEAGQFSEISKAKFCDEL